MQEHTPPQAPPAAPPAPDHAHKGGPTPVGTLGVIAALLLSISTLWLLVLGILEGRA